MRLDLGKVEVIATVIVNGKDLGIQWKPPFLVDVTDALRPGKNTLEIQVTNLWVNRLIRDEHFPDDMGFSTKGLLSTLPEWFVNNTPGRRKDERRSRPASITMARNPWSPSGLVGPVSLVTLSENSNALFQQIIRHLFTYSRNNEVQ